MTETAVPLEEASREKVEDILMAIADIPRMVMKHYCSADLHIDRISLNGGAEKLFYVLRMGLATRDQRLGNANLDEFAG